MTTLDSSEAVAKVVAACSVNGDLHRVSVKRADGEELSLHLCGEGSLALALTVIGFAGLQLVGEVETFRGRFVEH